MLECGEAPKSSLLAVTLLYVVCRSLPPLSVSLNDLQLSHVCIYVYGDFSLTIEILSNMETKLCLVLHIDRKPLNIQTTQLNRLRNVNAIVLFIQLHRSSTVHLRLFTVQPLPSQDGGELARRSNHNHIYICLWQQCPSPCLFIRPFFSFPVPQQSAADFYKIKACEQQTFTIIK